MKQSILFMVVTCAIAGATSGQSFQRQINTVEKFIPITDKRDMGTGSRDTTAAGRSLNDVTVDRFRSREGEKVSSYFINFYKLYLNTLTCYTMIHEGEENFDQAAYKWHNDSVVTVRLLNSISGVKVSYKMDYNRNSCCSAGLIFD